MEVRLSKQVTLRILLASAAVGVAVILFGLFEWQRARASEKWPTVDGIVLSSGIAWHRTSSDGGGRGSRSFTPDITYRYEIYGDIYENNRVMFAQHSSNTERGVRPIVDRYPEGSMVTVYYHPRKPQLSVLEPGATFGNAFIFLFGAIWMLGSLGFLWIFTRSLPDDVTRMSTTP